MLSSHYHDRKKAEPGTRRKANVLSGNFLYAVIYRFNILLKEILHQPESSNDCDCLNCLASYCPSTVHKTKKRDGCGVMWCDVIFLGSMEFLLLVSDGVVVPSLPCQSLSVKSHSCPANSPPRCWGNSAGNCIPCKFCTIPNSNFTSICTKDQPRLQESIPFDGWGILLNLVNFDGRE